MQTFGRWPSTKPCMESISSVFVDLLHLASMAKSLRVSRQAYGKIFLHAAKYFDCPLIGYVVGHESSGTTTIADVLPVCHTNPAGPIMEISGDVADATFSAPDQIIGVYFASDRLNNEHAPASNVQRIIDGIVSITGRPCIVLQVSNTLLSSKDKVFLTASTSNKTVCKCELVDTMQFISSLLDALLIQKIQHAFVDFEDHMNSSAESGVVDFRNPIASNFIQHYTPTVK